MRRYNVIHKWSSNADEQTRESHILAESSSDAVQKFNQKVKQSGRKEVLIIDVADVTIFDEYHMRYSVKMPRLYYIGLISASESGHVVIQMREFKDSLSPGIRDYIGERMTSKGYVRNNLMSILRRINYVFDRDYTSISVD